jgi:hypothetical protein
MEDDWIDICERPKTPIIDYYEIKNANVTDVDDDDVDVDDVDDDVSLSEDIADDILSSNIADDILSSNIADDILSSNIADGILSSNIADGILSSPIINPIIKLDGFPIKRNYKLYITILKTTFNVSMFLFKQRHQNMDWRVTAVIWGINTGVWVMSRYMRTRA